MATPSTLAGRGRRMRDQIRPRSSWISKERLRHTLLWGLWCCLPNCLVSVVAQRRNEVKEQTTILCGLSNVIYPGGHVTRLTPKLILHWKVSKSDDSLYMAFQYIGGQAWLGVGFSASGSMVGGRAIYGIPSNGLGSNSTLQAYKLISKGPQPADAVDFTSDFTLVHNVQGHVDMKSFETVISFSLTGLSDLQTPDEDNLYTLIYAVGKSTEFGMHAQRGAFRLNLHYCDGDGDGDSDSSPSPPVTPTSTAPSPSTEKPASAPSSFIPTVAASTSQPPSETHEIPPPTDPTPTLSPAEIDTNDRVSGVYTYDHKTAFAAHGFLAALAFGVLVPAAVASTWFRALLPKWWIYVHVLSNCTGFVCAALSVVAAFFGMVLRSQPDGAPVPHMTISHHWTGLVLLLVVSYQVVSGFCRPPLQQTQVDSGEEGADGGGSGGDHRVCGWTRAIPRWGKLSRREKWHWAHRWVAVTILALAVYQLISGTSLYSVEYQDGRRTAVAAMWVWLAILATSFLGVKLLLISRAAKAAGSGESAWGKPQLVRRRAPPLRTSSSTSSAGGAAGVWRSSPSSPQLQRHANLLPYRDDTSREDDDPVAEGEPRHAELKAFTNVV